MHLRCNHSAFSAQSSCVKDNEKVLAEISEKKGAINQELKADAENKKRSGLLVEDAEKKKFEYQKWSRMDQLLGDATGKTFRKIAQSYVLNSLIHSANSYMKTLTDRYTLKVAPGTFVISLVSSRLLCNRLAISVKSRGVFSITTRCLRQKGNTIISLFKSLLLPLPYDRTNNVFATTKVELFHSDQ